MRERVRRIHSTSFMHIYNIIFDPVFYCKTNLPQSIMHLETYSFWGQVVNPYNTAQTAGGSSGGCSALVAFGGALMSTGSDIGGSLRSPSAACGLWTLSWCYLFDIFSGTDTGFYQNRQLYVFLGGRDRALNRVRIPLLKPLAPSVGGGFFVETRQRIAIQTILSASVMSIFGSQSS